MNTLATDVDQVLELLRQLPHRERLRVVVEVLPELERELPAATPARDFWGGSDLKRLAEQQLVRPVEDFDALLGGWPEEESIDDFIVALRESRKQNPAEAR